MANQDREAKKEKAIKNNESHCNIHSNICEFSASFS